MKFVETLNEEMKEYFKILSPEFPEFLEEYIVTPEMARIGKISIACGWDYSSYYGTQYFMSNLHHSVAVALVVWHFTKDKKQTLAGLFHDIATPVFKHCIDFMNGDAATQESTEEKTYEILKNSKQIMALLKRDGIQLEEVANYHIYPVADNDTPKLSADRLEYTFSTGLVEKRVWTLDKIKECYNDMVLSTNEEGITEIAFKTQSIAEEYVHIISTLWPIWNDEKDKTFMQCLADLCKSMNKIGYLSIEDLYTLPESQVVDKMLNCPDKYLATAMKNFVNGKDVVISDEPINGRYCAKVKGKYRYIIPLVHFKNGAKRIYDLSSQAKADIDGYLSQKFDKYGCLDFDFKPYK